MSPVAGEATKLSPPSSPSSSFTFDTPDGESVSSFGRGKKFLGVEGVDDKRRVGIAVGRFAVFAFPFPFPFVLDDVAFGAREPLVGVSIGVAGVSTALADALPACVIGAAVAKGVVPCNLDGPASEPSSPGNRL
jgi:hypothetical protein